MKVLSLFDGMACGMIAFRQAGIQVDRYVAYEIDKYAIQSAKHNFPFIEECGDVFNADFTQYEGFDAVIGGSPCTYWSIAQTKNREVAPDGFGGRLFEQYFRAVCEAKPKWFIYENNKSMSKAIRQYISGRFGFDPVCINSALVSAQNRQRLYWVGKRNSDGTYSKVNVDQPQDRGILLKDIIEKGESLFEIKEGPCCMRYERTDEGKECRKDYESHLAHHGFHEMSELHPRQDGKTNTLSTVTKDNQICEQMPEPICTTQDGKSFTVVATEYKGETIERTLKKHKRTKIAGPVRIGCMPSPDGKIKNSQAMRVYSIDGKTVNLVSQGGGLGAKTGLYIVPVNESEGKSQTIKGQYAHTSIANLVTGKSSTFGASGVAEPCAGRVVGRRINEDGHRDDYNEALERIQRFEVNKGPEKTNHLTTVDKDNLVACSIPQHTIPIEWDSDGIPTKAVSGADGKEYTVYPVSNGMITIKGKTYPIKLNDGYYIIRKLTVGECKRLQTVPDWYEFPVSNTQAYKQLGNGWTVEVIVHIINSIYMEL